MSRSRSGAAIALVFLIGLSMGWLSSAHAQVIHENPANLTSQQPFDVNGTLAHQLEHMFDALDSVTMYINASDFNNSRLSLSVYEQYYQFFAEYLNHTSLLGSDYQRIVGQAGLIAADLQTMINDSEGFDGNMKRFQAYRAGGDLPNATQAAVELQKHYTMINGTSGRLAAGVSAIRQMVENTSVNVNRLDEGTNTLNVYMGRVNKLNELPQSMLNDANLTMVASQQQVATGDVVEFDCRLESNGAAIGGGYITLYVDGKLAGNGTISGDGSCIIFYKVKGGSFGSTMSAVAYFEPGAREYAPAVSNNVVLYRKPIPVELSVQVTPDKAAFSDTVLVEGRLTADGGYSVPSHLVAVYFPGKSAFYVTTLADGSYSCTMNITSGTPAGAIDVISMFGAYTVPGEALASPATQSARLQVLQEDTSLALEPPPAILTGGEDATFAGTLVSSTGKPAGGEAIDIYADNMLIGGNISTDGTGRYSATMAIPLNLTAGQHDVYAVYSPDAGMALAGSESGRYIVDTQPARPEIAVSGIPLAAFPGDMLNLTGKVTAPGGPGVKGLALTISAPDRTLGSVVTGANGTFSLSSVIEMPAGMQPVTIVNDQNGLMLSTQQEVGRIYVMPLDFPATAVIFVIIMLAAGLILSRVRRVRHALSGLLLTGRKQLPKFTVAVTPLPEPTKMPASPSLRLRLEDEIARVEAIAAKGAESREIFTEIYQISRRIASAHGFALPDSATHREFFKGLTAREPSLVTSAGTITKNYESAVFGSKPLGAQDIAISLDSLREIDGRMSAMAAGGGT